MWSVRGINEIYVGPTSSDPISNPNHSLIYQISNPLVYSDYWGSGDLTQIWVKIRPTQSVNIEVRGNSCGFLNQCDLFSSLDFSSGVEDNASLNITGPSTVIPCSSGDLTYTLNGNFQQTNSSQFYFWWTLGSGWEIKSGQGTQQVVINNKNKSGTPTLQVHAFKNFNTCNQSSIYRSVSFTRDLSNLPEPSDIVESSWINFQGMPFTNLNQPPYDWCKNQGYHIIGRATNIPSHSETRVIHSVSSPNGNAKLVDDGWYDYNMRSWDSNLSGYEFVNSLSELLNTGNINSAYANNDKVSVAPMGETEVDVTIQLDFNCRLSYTTYTEKFYTKSNPAIPYIIKDSQEPNCSSNDITYRIQNQTSDIISYSWTSSTPSSTPINHFEPFSSSINNEIIFLDDYLPNTSGKQPSVPNSVNTVNISATAENDCFLTSSTTISVGFNNSAQTPSISAPDCYYLGGEEFPYLNEVRIDNPQLNLGITYGWIISYKNQSGNSVTLNPILEDFGTVCKFDFDGDYPSEVTFICIANDCQNNPTATLTLNDLYVIENPSIVCTNESTESKKGFFSNHNEITIFPSPADNFFTISTDLPGKKEIRIYNVTGELVEEMELESNLINVSSENWKAGSYIVHISNNDNSYAKKLLIK
ncbi:T9SS type A sorting domain-containing protein [Hyphobacterium sp. CCMP332]|nr:T9SS type A sorting domain-containing protein [Hyphobacterium sp. CCMP332]